MGFIHHIRQIVKQLPAARQTLFFSATMPKDVASLAEGMLKSPERVAVTPVASTVERIDQRVVFVETAVKNKALQALLGDAAVARAIVFTRTKHGADRVARHLDKVGIPNGVIHGNKSQNNRERALAAFRSGNSRLLIATDIAARGIDVDGVTHVINFDLPNVPETYVHRIGRTARAGAEGLAISFCSRDERPFLKDIEKLTKQQIAPMPLAFDATPEPRSGESRSGETRKAEQHGTERRDGRGPGHRSGNHGKGGQGRGARPGEAKRGDQRKSSHGKPQTRAGSPAPGSPAALAEAVTRRDRDTTGPVRFGQRAGA
jgi:ATP-dependent RNA helicase RhlE